MRDPFPFQAPAPLVAAVSKFADLCNLPTLPLHAHEVIFALALYTFIGNVISPWLSTRLCPQTYPKLSRRTKINWDVHVVSFVQSCVICLMSFYVIFFDEERKTWRPDDQWEKRIFGYTGLTGLLQSFGLGYFMWDLYMCARFVNIFGWGMLAHAISAVTVFSFGFRPFLYFYAPSFLLYELSSPFLNIHWFCDKLELTGSVYQAVNGAFLTGTFFLCRLCWGTYSSVLVFKDVARAVQRGYAEPHLFSEKVTAYVREGEMTDTHGQASAFLGVRYVPLWLAVAYLTSNVVLNTLNFFWFNKMIATIRKRFDPPWGTKGIGPDEIHYQPQEKPKGSVKAARERAEKALGSTPEMDDAAVIQRGVYEDGHKSVEVSGTRRSVRSRRKA